MIYSILKTALITLGILTATSIGVEAEPVTSHSYVTIRSKDGDYWLNVPIGGGAVRSGVPHFASVFVIEKVNGVHGQLIKSGDKVKLRGTIKDPWLRLAPGQFLQGGSPGDATIFEIKASTGGGSIEYDKPFQIRGTDGDPYWHIVPNRGVLGTEPGRASDFTMFDPAVPTKLAERHGPTTQTSGAVTRGTVHTQCVGPVWDDLPQPHTLTQWKKLRHCYQLSVTGPIDIEGIAKSYTNACLQKALRKDRVQRIVVAITALVADAYGGSGSATAAQLTNLVSEVTRDSMSCLTDKQHLADFMRSEVNGSFGATIVHKTHWIYWKV